MMLRKAIRSFASCCLFCCHRIPQKKRGKAHTILTITLQAWSPRQLSAAQKAQDRRAQKLHRFQLLEYRRTSLEEVGIGLGVSVNWFSDFLFAEKSASTTSCSAVHRRKQAAEGEQRQAAREGRRNRKIQREAARLAVRGRQVRKGEACSRAGASGKRGGVQEGNGRNGGREREKEKGEGRETQAGRSGRSCSQGIKGARQIIQKVPVFIYRTP